MSLVGRRITLPDAYHPHPFARSRLTLTHELGHGAYGRVYLAQRTDAPHRLCAVKHLPDRHLTPAQRQLQRREAHLHALCHAHSNVVSLHDSIEPTPAPSLVDTHRHIDGWFMVLEYCPDGDLFEFVVGGKLDTMLPAKASAVAADLIVQTCAALHHCHSLGIAHSDVKGENLLLSRNAENGRYEVRLADFGLACRVRDSVALPGDASHDDGRGCGSDFYMAYENRLSFTPAADHPPHLGCINDRRLGDIWAIGILLCNLATRRNPWYKASQRDPGFAEYMRAPNAATLKRLVPLLRYDVAMVMARILQLRPCKRPSLGLIAEWIRGLAPGWCWTDPSVAPVEEPTYFSPRDTLHGCNHRDHARTRWQQQHEAPPAAPTSALAITVNAAAVATPIRRQATRNSRDYDSELALTPTSPDPRPSCTDDEEESLVEYETVAAPEARPSSEVESVDGRGGGRSTIECLTEQELVGLPSQIAHRKRPHVPDVSSPTVKVAHTSASSSVSAYPERPSFLHKWVSGIWRKR